MISRLTPWLAVLAVALVTVVGLAQDDPPVSSADFVNLQSLNASGNRRVYLGRVQAGQNSLPVRTAVRRAARPLTACLRANAAYGDLIVRVQCTDGQCTATTNSSSTRNRRLERCASEAIARAIQGDVSARRAATTGARVALAFATGTASTTTRNITTQGGMGMGMMGGMGMGGGMGPSGGGGMSGGMDSSSDSQACHGGVPCGSGCCIWPLRCGDSQCHTREDNPETTSPTAPGSGR
ncbi:MAG: hypothetical protein AAGF12_43245 [Myxococcota bacterium]